MLRSAAVPESVLRELALMAPEVWPSRLLRSDAVTEVSEMLMFSSPSPVTPERP